MAKKTTMKISKDKAVRVFEHFGFKTAGKWTPEKMTEKLNNLIESIDPKVKIKSKKVKALVAELVAADTIVVKAGEKDKEAATPKDKKDKGKAKDDKKTVPPKKRGITRLDAATKVLLGMKKKGLTVEEVVAASDEMCVEDGGTSNLNEAKYSFKLAVRVLEVAELITVSEDKESVRLA